MNQRLQKILSAAGVASRRASETMIQDGRVTINGQVATVGMSADPDVDVVAVDGTPIAISQRRRYIILNKPKGYVTTMKDDRDRPTVAELVADAGGRLYPVGRLDMDSEGLLLMTDDGAVANALMHPSHEVNKVYTVFVQGMDITASLRQLQQMEKLDGEPISRAQVMLIERKGTGAEIQMTIHEGKNRQIRRMCQACGLSVSRLIRVAEGPIVLGDLPLGKWRNLTGDELSFLHDLV
jgi:23S rRNA pseudouridine2605 synthase